MEYRTDIISGGGGSLTQRLCRLMTSFDETVAVMPYRSVKAHSRYDMWLVPMNDGKVLCEYVGGTRKVSEGFRLYLRHRALTSKDVDTAERVLDGYLKRLSEAAEGCSVRRGEVRREVTDESTWELFASFTVCFYEAFHFDGVKFYVTFGTEAPVRIDVGCTVFREVSELDCSVRRYFDGDLYFADKTAEKRSIEFEFETEAERCALRPIINGAETVTVYTVCPSGDAEAARYVLSHLTLACNVCKGTLVSDGGFTRGSFDSVTGEFSANGTEGGDGLEMYNQN